MIELHTTVYGANMGQRRDTPVLLQPHPQPRRPSSPGYRHRTVMFDTEYFIASHHDSFEYDSDEILPAITLVTQTANTTEKTESHAV